MNRSTAHSPARTRWFFPSFLALFAWTAQAQTPPSAPPQVSQGVLVDQLRRLLPDSSIPDTVAAPVAAPAPAYPPGADSRQVTVRSVAISGNSALQGAELSPYADALVGKEVPVTALYDLAFRLTSVYRNRGYVLSSVVVEGRPEQNGLPDGVLRLAAIEGYVARVAFDNEALVSPRIRAEALALTEERPLTIATFERQMLLINDLPGVAAQAYLAPTDTPGATLLTLTTQRTTVNGFAGVQNRVSDLLGNVLIEGRVSINNAFGLDEGQTLLLQTTDRLRLRSIGYAYDQPIGHSGLAFNAFLAHVESKSPVTAALSGLGSSQAEEVRSKSDVATFGLSYPLLRSRLESLRLRARLHIYDGDQRGTLTQARLDERVRALRLGASYDRRDASGINFADAEFSNGLSGLGSTDGAAPDAIRRNADYGFSKVNVTLGRLQRLGGPFSLQASVQGQWTNDRLPSSERYALGGEVILRAFDAGDLIGDRAAAGKLELRYEPAWIPGGQYVIYAFAEYGRTTSLEVAPTRDIVSKGGSTGVGIRGTISNRLNVYAEAATPHARNPSSTANRRTRFFAGLSYQF